MEESKKKPLMIGAIIVCLIAAVAITFSGRSSKNTGISRYAGKPQWLQCNNPDCGAEYTMDKKKYFEWHQVHYAISAAAGTGMTCKECGEDTAFEAIKCEKCEHVFLRGAAGITGFTDRCPECDYSKTEDERKKARQAR